MPHSVFLRMVGAGSATFLKIVIKENSLHTVLSSVAPWAI